MSAKPKSYIGAGFYEPFQFGPKDLARLGVQGFSEDEIAYIQERATILRILERDTRERPTPAEIRAALEQGEKALSSLIEWLSRLDSATHDLLVEVGRRMAAQPIIDLAAHLDRLADCVEMARRETGEGKSGRLPDHGKAGFVRAMQVRFGPKRAHDAIRSVLKDDSKDNLRKLARRKK